MAGRHVALVSVLKEAGQPANVAGGRYVVFEPGKAEAAFVVVDQHQGPAAASCRDRPPGRARRADRRGPDGKHRQAEGVREKRAPPRDKHDAGVVAHRASTYEQITKIAASSSFPV